MGTKEKHGYFIFYNLFIKISVNDHDDDPIIPVSMLSSFLVFEMYQAMKSVVNSRYMNVYVVMNFVF